MDKPISWLRYVSDKYGFWPMFLTAVLLLVAVAAALYFGLPALDLLK
jgi:hypothetical protein